MTTPHDIPDEAETDVTPLSKTRRKQAMHELQEMGEQLVALPVERLEQLELPERLHEAILAAQHITRHEARRRQMQFIGKLMRNIDPQPVRALLDKLDGAARVETARQRQLEQLRARLLENEAVLEQIAPNYFPADIEYLRILRLKSLREKELGRPPASYREIFRVLREAAMKD